MTGGIRADLPTGDHELVFHFDHAVVLAATNKRLVRRNRPGQMRRWNDIQTQWTSTVSYSVTVLPRNQSHVRLVNDPSRDPVPIGTLHISQVEIRPDKRKARAAIVHELKPPFDVPLCFEVRMTIKGTVYRMGKLATVRMIWPHPTNQFGQPNVGTRLAWIRIDPPDPSAEIARIELIPDQTSAEQDPECNEIWGKPIVFDNVLLNRSDAKQP